MESLLPSAKGFAASLHIHRKWRQVALRAKSHWRIQSLRAEPPYLL